MGVGWYTRGVPDVRVRIVCAKNKKEELVPLVPEICEALKACRPPDCLPQDLGFPNGVPRAQRLRADLEANGIAYQDVSGRDADFHALRYTWATFLQRHGIAQRFAMKLLRHSDIKLTSQVYTDESQLPIYEAIKALPRLVEHTQIRAQISGGAEREVTPPDAESEGKGSGEDARNNGFGRGLASAGATRQKQRVKGIEPSYAAWEAAVLPLNYTRGRRNFRISIADCKPSNHCQEITSSVAAVELLAPVPPVLLFPSDQAITPCRMLAVPAPVLGS